MPLGTAACIIVRSGFRAVFALFAVTFAIFAPVLPTRAGELEYQNCMRQICEGTNQDQVICARSCLADLNGRPNYTPLPPIPTLWGAVAVDPATLASGFGKGYASRADAERRALAICHRADGTATGCKIVASRHNTCLALATSRGGGGEDMWGDAWSDDGWVSRREAVKQCREGGGVRCEVVVSFCTG